MIDAAELDSGVADKRRRGRVRSRSIVALGVVVALIVAGGVSAIVHHVHQQHLDAQYGPIDAGPAWGIVETDIDRITAGDVTRIAGPSGTEVHVVATISNDGSHAVTVTDVDKNTFVTAVHWARMTGNFLGVHDETELRSFPATIPAHSFIFIVSTVRKPAHCATLLSPGAGIGVSTTLGVHWQSILGDHESDVETHDMSLSVC